MMSLCFHSRAVFAGLLILGLALVPMAARGQDTKGPDDGALQILLLGDSTTEGSIPRLLRPEGPHLGEVLEQVIRAEGNLPPCKVIVSGRSGETIRSLIDQQRYLHDIANLPGLDYIFVRYGINDQAGANFEENFPKDYKELIGLLRKDHPGAVIIPTTVTPFFGKEMSKQINDLVKQVGKSENLDVFDLYPVYAAALKKGPNMLNYRQYPLEKIPKAYQDWVKPFVHGTNVIVLNNELDALFGNLPGWYDNRHPNLAGYNVIAVATAKYLIPLLKDHAGQK